MLNTPRPKTALFATALAVATMTSASFAERFRLIARDADSHRALAAAARVDPDRLARLTGAPDLAVTSVSLVRSSESGATYLKVKVSNVGRAHWRSRPDQQAVMAYVHGAEFLVSRNIKALDAGQSRSFAVPIPSYWGPGVEFPPNLTVRIVVDPDAKLDGNPANDDRNSINDRKLLGGQVANAMLGG